ncbi:C4-dicarboxylate ABC transporter permease [candidate division KSB3 bacterium]|uniref:C4-dicarboxylate ABC transporter permease n=1 Tax=candidate division KSB3 bacterium TaxID=2044937 RepID=A0A2G6E5D3_9BACT|nr:MAG: C4-dicarboxylate ABC transporter permease [candidate division KSB3 bacterium]PIE29845.1 MAG: C4-dicarboxylate ABC transporter permease [candidate division KSB3 bacterium]
MTILITIFIVTMAMGIPIAFVFGISSIVYFLFLSNMPLTMIGLQLYNGVDSFVLLAIPFFILAGQLMNRTGITKDLVEFVQVLVGRLPGALAQVNIVVSILFAGLTGAAVADTAAIGSILIPAMKKEGYAASYSAAVTTASSIIGPIIPPSIIMVIYGTITGESIGALFMGGFIPGVLIGVGLMILASVYAIREHHPRRTESIPRHEIWRRTKSALVGIIMPVIIIGGILTGQFTATEAASLACGYALLVGLLLYRSLTVKDILESLLEAAVVSSVILLIISTAKLFGMILTIERIPTQIAQIMMSVTENKIIFLLLVNVFLLFMGMIMETGANIILLAPILLPLAVKYGVHPLHFALIMIVNVNIGLTTPPLGVCLFTAAPIAKTSYESIAIKVLPFVAMEILVLLVITYIPDLVLIVPKLTGFL